MSICLKRDTYYCYNFVKCMIFNEFHLICISTVFSMTLQYNVTPITVLYKTEHILRKIFAVLSSEGK